MKSLALTRPMTEVEQRYVMRFLSAKKFRLVQIVGKQSESAFRHIYFGQG
jgi:hypothetical protein